VQASLARPVRVLSRTLSALRARPRERFVNSMPSAQTAVDAIDVDWASRFPPPLDDVRAGQSQLFDDPRMKWGFERLGGLDGRTVLELGPLEGAHSYMAHQAGAARIVAVESNKQAFLKCLVVKEVFDLQRCSFLCGDVGEYMSGTSEVFDVCFACGILYHMAEPVKLLDLISQRAGRLLMWTHYYDGAAVAGTPVAKRLGPAEQVDYNGFRHEVHRHRYGITTRMSGFWGGNRPYSNWLPREHLLGALERFGWRDVEIAFEEPDHPHGPALALVAVRT
jgi:hypothetical protein